MTLSTRGRWLVAGTLGLGLGVVLYTSSRHDNPSIIQGHWRAENFRLASITLPIAPEIDISSSELRADGIQARLPIQRMEREGDEVTLTLPLGVGLVFTFDGPDRMFIDVPLVGPVFYRRAGAVVAAAPHRTAPPSLQPSRAAERAAPTAPVVPAPPVVVAVNVPSSTSPAPVATPAAPAAPVEDYPMLLRAVSERMAHGDLAGAEPALARAQARYPRDAELTYLAAVLQARRGRTDAAIEQLRQAMNTGFRDVSRLQRDEGLASLRSDVRYQALLALHR